MLILDKSGRPFEDRRDHQEPITGEIAWADPLHLFANQQTQYNPNILVSRKRLQIFDQIRRDDQVKAAITFKKHALISTGWRIESPIGKPDDWEPTVFIEEQLKALDGTFKEALIQVLSALDYGYSVTERIHDIEGGQVNLAALKTRAPHSMEFATDEYGNLLPDGVVQIDRGDSGEVRMPTRKFVLLQYQKEFGNPYGISDLDATYKAWWGKDNAYKWMMMLLERHGVPPIFALYNSAKYKGGSLTDLRQVVQALQAASTGTIPRSDKDDLEFWAPEMAGQVSTVFVPALKMMNEDIARSILMPGLMGLTPETNTGSLARARVIFDVFILVVDYLRSIVEERVVDEQIIKPLVAANFPVDEFPCFKFNPITEDSRTELLKAWAELVGAGTIVNTKDDEDHIRQLLDFPEREGEEPPPGPQEPEDEDPDEPDDEGPDDEGPDEEEPEDEPVEAVFQQATGEPIQREETAAEKRVDFTKIDRELDALQKRAVDSLTATLRAVEKTITNRIRKSGPSILAPKIMPAQKARIMDAMQDLVSGAAKSGSRSLKRELPKRFQEPASASPEDAIKYLDEKILWITDVLTQRVLEESRQAMLKSIEVGDSTQEAMERLKEVFSKYVGSGQITREGELLKPSRIETIVRTNTTDAFNQGRLTEIMRPELDGFVDFVQYSAIEDTRTTPICRLLDGKIFRRDDPALQDFKPPNHFNAVESGTYITTDKGSIPIEQIQVGDKVLTHCGRWRRVYAVMGKPADTPNLRELTFSTGRVLRITDEHPVLTGSGWARTDELEIGDVIFENGDQVPGSVDMGVKRPDDYPSLFDQEPVPYQMVSFARGAPLRRVDLQRELDGRESEVDHISPDGMLKDERTPGIGQDSSHGGLGSRRALTPSFCSAEGGLLGCAFGVVSVVFAHALAVLARPLVRFLSETVSPMAFSAAFGNDFRLLVGDRAGLLFGHYADTEAFTEIIQSRLSKSERALNRADGLAVAPMASHNELKDGFSVGEIHKSIPWCGAAIVVAVKKPVNADLWNLAVKEDESYVANGLIVHNCRSLLVPITPDIDVDEKELVTPKVSGRAEELKGTGFAEAGGAVLDSLNVDISPPNIDVQVNQEPPQQPNLNVVVHPPNVTVNVPKPDATTVEVTTPEPVVNVQLESPSVNVTNQIESPEIPPPNITVESPAVTVEAPNVNIEPAQVTVNPKIDVKPEITVDKTKGVRRVDIKHDSAGKISGATIEDT